MSDSGGPAKDICNAEAVRLAIDTYAPQRLIYITNSTVFEKNRAQPFFDILDHLKRILPEATSEDVLDSILFVVNDQLEHENDKRLSLEDVIKSIKKARKILKKDVKSLLPPEKGWLDSLLERKSKKEQKQLLEDNLDPMVGTLNTKIEILDKILKLKNVIVADIFNENTREEVEAWRGRTSKKTLSFEMDNFVRGGHHKFFSTLRETVVYFSSLFNDKKSIEDEINQLIQKIEWDENQLKEWENFVTGADNISVEIEKRQKIICLNTMRIKLWQEELDRKGGIKEQIENLEQQRIALTTEEEIPWLKIKSLNPIDKRGFWNWGPLGYELKHKSDTPIERVVPDIPLTKKGKKSGFFRSFDESKLAEGIFEASFEPQWYGYREACKMNVGLFVKKKNHPDSVANLKLIDQALDGSAVAPEGLRARRTRLENDIMARERSNSMLSAEIESLENDGETIEIYKGHLEELVKLIEDQKAEQKVKESVLEELQNKMDPYKDFCKLMCQIIRKMDLDNSSNSSEQDLFKKFLENFA
jgi:hypothetical protein